MTARDRAAWPFLAAYTCSGIAGLIYQVTWTRLLTLYLGHSTAAASTVISVFIGGLCAGALLAATRADRMTRQQALRAYAFLESIVLVSALALPWAIHALMPVLRRFYEDGNHGTAFLIARAGACAGVLFVPTIALGATFPLATRWFVSDGRLRSSGILYAANTVGAAAGSLAAGFVLLPALGQTTTNQVGAIATATSMLVAVVLARRVDEGTGQIHAARTAMPSERNERKIRVPGRMAVHWPIWMAGFIVAVTGFTTFVLEIVWMRLLAMVIGPSTYAFSATAAAFITALAAGAVAGEAVLVQARRGAPALRVVVPLVAAGVCVMWASSYTGTWLVGQIARGEAAWPPPSLSDLSVQALLVASAIVPGALFLGMLFPLALATSGGRAPGVTRRVAYVYGMNTMASVAGSLVAGFVLIPTMGLQHTIRFACALLFVGAGVVAFRLIRSHRGRTSVAAAIAVSVSMLIWMPEWDRELLAAGAYHQARPTRLNVDASTAAAALKAGTLLYYREGTAGTVSVKWLNGALSLAIDGKVDASTADDMLTQKALAHLPLLMHERPSQVAIIGLGSGVTLASALVHPVIGVDVIELSPEVVEASDYFSHENSGALSDPRTRLIVGDGRTHLLLSDRRYDVIVSEPSNPWMAGVATLFTREFFLAARDRLTPGGLLCQWTHTYNMSEADLRSIVATFASVFPDGTMWKVGDGDLLLIGSGDEAPPALANIARAWDRPGVAADLAEVGAKDPFALLSMFLGNSPELRAFAAGAALQADDRLALEFSGPFAALGGGVSDNGEVLERLSRSTPLPEPVARALADADGRAWRNRGTMMLKAGAHDAAYASFARAVAADSSDRAALDGLVDTALTIDRYDEALHALRQVTADRPDDRGPLIALSRLHASAGRFEEAIDAAIRASEIRPTSADAMEQLASIYADLGDGQNLSPISAQLRRTFPERPGSFYYSAAAEFLAGRLAPALEAIEHAISLDGGSANVHNLRGAIHARLGRVADARAAFQTALTLDPRDSATYANYGLLELALGNREDAANLFGEALALDPASPVGRQGIAAAQLTSR